MPSKLKVGDRVRLKSAKELHEQGDAAALRDDGSNADYHPSVYEDISLLDPREVYTVTYVSPDPCWGTKSVHIAHVLATDRTVLSLGSLITGDDLFELAQTKYPSNRS